LGRGCGFQIRERAMTISTRDRRALQMGAAALSLWLILRFAVLPLWDNWQQSRAELPTRELALIKYRQVVNAAGMEKKSAESLANRLRETESGLLQSATPALASAELQDWARQAAVSRGIEVRSSEFLPVQPPRNGYAQIPLGLQFQCRLDQLVDWLSEVRSGPRILGLSRLQIQSNGGPEKLINVSLTLTGAMRAASVPGSATP
jgi:Tfp pilus assembly protein PilO